VADRADQLREAFYKRMDDEEFNNAITYGPNDASKVRHRFAVGQEMFEETLNDLSS